jgi:hypothetical protein
MWKEWVKATYSVTNLYIRVISVTVQVTLASHQCILYEDFSHLEIYVQVPFNYVNPVHIL